MPKQLDRPQPLRLALHGFNDRNRNALMMFLEGRGREHGRVVSNRDSEVDLVDLDTLAGQEFWARARETAQRPVLLLSVLERDHPDTIWVRKPLDCDTLIDALQRIRVRLGTDHDNATPGPGAAAVSSPELPAALTQALPANDAEESPPRRPAARARHVTLATTPASDANSAPAAAAPDVGAEHVDYLRAMRTYYGELEDAAYRDASRREALCYDPDQYLQGALARAIRRATRSGIAQSLEGLGKLLVVDPVRQQILTDMRDKYLRSVCLQSSRTVKIQLRPTRVDAHATEDVVWHDCDATLWKVALWCSRGRMPLGTAPDTPVHVRAWPNFTRLASPPHAIQIIASWNRQPVALLETATELGIPRRAVFSVFSACRALGLVESGAAPLITRTGPDAPGGRAVPRQLLGTLLGRLG